MKCLESADKLIHGPRRASYGPVEESFKRHALVWNGVLLPKLKEGMEITPQDVALMMVGLKVTREANAHSQDNLDDICGYTALLEELYDKDPAQSFIDSEACRDLGRR